MKPSLISRLVLLTVAANTAHAAGTTTTWTNLAGGSWGTPGNWSAAPTFVADDVLDFSTLNITANATTTIDGTRTAGTLKFGDATTASNNWTLNAGSGGPLTLAVGTGVPVINVVNQTATIGAELAGTQGFQKTGTGTLVLSGTNTYSGATNVSAGILTATNAAALPGYNTAGGVVLSGGTVNLLVGGAGWTTAEVNALLANATKTSGAVGIDTTNGNLTQWTAFTDTNLSPTIGLRKFGNNTLTLNQANTYTGLTTVSGGTVTVSGNQSAATGGWSLNGTSITVNFNSNIVLGTGKTISFVSGSADNTRILNVTAAVTTSTTSTTWNAGGTTINLNSGANWIQNALLRMEPNTTFTDAVMNVNSGASFTYAGGTRITLTNSPGTNGGDSFLNLNGGTFTTGQGFNHSSAGTAGTANLTFSNGGILKLSAEITDLVTGSSTRPFNVTVGSGGGKIDTDGHSTTLALGISGTGSLDKLGAGTLTLTGTNTYTGATAVDAGTLSVQATDQFSDSAALALTTGATLDLNFTGTDTVGNFRIDGVTQAAGTWGAPGSGAAHETSLITGAGLINNTNSAAEFYWDGTGTAWSSTGAWAYDAANAAFNPPSVPDSTSLAFFGGNGLTTDQTVQLGGDRALAALTFTSPVTFNFTGGGTNSTLTVGASGITVNAASFGATFGSATAGQQVNLALGAAQTWTNSAISGPVTLTNGLSLGANTLTTAGAGSFTVNGAISGTGGLRKMGAGDLALSGTDTFTGDKTIDRGTVTVASNQNAANGSWIFRGYGDTGSTYNTVATTVNFEPGSAVTVTTGKTVQLGNTSSNGGFQGQTLNANGTVTGNGSLFLGRGGLLNVGGSWTQNGTATVAAQGGGIATMTVTPGGSFTYTSATQFVLSNSSASGTLAVNGGTFTTGVKLHNTNAGAGGTNPAKVVLSNGGTLKLSAAIADLFTTAGGAQSFQVGSGGGIVDTNSFSTTLNVDVSGTGGLTKSGAGTLTTTGVNSYTGDTTVNGGILSVAGPDFDDASSVTIASGSKLNLNFAGTDTVAGLTINGTSLPAGVYSASTHAAFITGTGTLTVATSGSTPSFATWASGLGLSGNPDADFDKDGIADAAEYVLGTNPNAASSSGITPQKSGSNLIFTFSRSDDSETSDTTLTVEAGTTLGAWPQVFNVGATTGASSAGVVVTENGAAADTVAVTIPTSGAAKLFAHLKVLVTP